MPRYKGGLSVEISYIICEGSSEANYIARLNAYLNDVDYTWSFDNRIVAVNCGSGILPEVEKCLRREYANQRKDNRLVWVDYDLYSPARTEKSWHKDYVRRIPGGRAFYFSFHNFEDFLALHFDDSAYAKYAEIVLRSGHAAKPLHGREYAALFNPIYSEFTGEDYRKGMLSDGFVCRENLCNMIRHLENRAISPVVDPAHEDFAKWLAEYLTRHSMCV